jgi:hypothetical protein
LAKTTPTRRAAGFVITRVSEGYGVARGGEVQSVHATRDEAAAMIAALARHASPPTRKSRARTPARPS